MRNVAALMSGWRTPPRCQLRIDRVVHTRTRSTFLALVLAQSAHSIEEYVGRLWESFPPAAFLTGLVSANREVGFLVINIALVLFGLWCVAVPVRRDWTSASSFMWFWAILQTINGIGHLGWSLVQRSYTPGVLTAPLLLALALVLARQLRRQL
jgi:hypothetical protein